MTALSIPLQRANVVILRAATCPPKPGKGGSLPASKQESVLLMKRTVVESHAMTSPAVRMLHSVQHDR